eukprot:15335482-Ditylum_brightwellii.AAC.1
MFLLAKALTINTIKNLEDEELNSFPENPDDATIVECYIDKEDNAVPLHSYPLNFKLIQKEQQKDKMFLEAIKNSKTKYDIKVFQGMGKSRYLIYQKSKMIVPLTLQKRIMDWYHTLLCHPDIKHMELTIC